VFNAFKISLWGLFSALALISFPSYAATYWGDCGFASNKGSSPCTGYYSAKPWLTPTGIDYVNDNRYTCNFDNDGNSGAQDQCLFSNPTCPNEVPYEWSDGTCHEEEQPSCESGITDYVLVEVSDYKAPPSSFPSTYTIGSCEYSFTSMDSCSTSSNGEVQGCWVTVTGTGNASSGSDTGTSTGGTSPPMPETNNVQSTSDTTVSTTGPDTAPDGTTTETETTTTTDVNNQGTVIDNGDNTITVIDSDGTITVYSNNKTTTTHPDGSVTEQINKDTTVTNGQKTTNVIDKASGNVTTINKNSTSNTYNQQVTNTYNSSGAHTGTTSSSSGSATGDGTGTDDSTKEGNCGAPGQPPCDVTIEDTTEDSHTQGFKDTEAELKAKRDGVLAELANHNEDFGLGGVSEFSSSNFISNYLPLPNVTTCSGEINTTIFGFPFILAPCDDLAPLREILAWVFFVLTVFSVINITLGRKIV